MCVCGGGGVSAVTVEIRRGIPTPRGWSYRQLWATWHDRNWTCILYRSSGLVGCRQRPPSQTSFCLYLQASFPVDMFICTFWVYWRGTCYSLTSAGSPVKLETKELFLQQPIPAFSASESTPVHQAMYSLWVKYMIPTTPMGEISELRTFAETFWLLVRVEELQLGPLRFTLSPPLIPQAPCGHPSHRCPAERLDFMGP